MKITLKTVFVFLFLSLLVIRPTPSYAYWHGMGAGMAMSVLILVYGQVLIIMATPIIPIILITHPYYPQYAVVSASSYQPVVVNGVTYYVNNGVYYIYTQYGYQAVAAPAGAPAPVIQTATVAAAPQSSDTR